MKCKIEKKSDEYNFVLHLKDEEGNECSILVPKNKSYWNGEKYGLNLVTIGHYR